MASLFAKKRSTAVKNAPFSSSFVPIGEGASILPPTLNDCASGSTYLWIVVVVDTSCFTSNKPSDLYEVSAEDIKLLPGRGVAFVELLVTLNVLIPVEILTVGAGTVFGSFRKNDPIKSP